MCYKGKVLETDSEKIGIDSCVCYFEKTKSKSEKSVQYRFLGDNNDMMLISKLMISANEDCQYLGFFIPTNSLYKVTRGNSVKSIFKVDYKINKA